MTGEHEAAARLRDQLTVKAQVCAYEPMPTRRRVLDISGDFDGTRRWRTMVEAQCGRRVEIFGGVYLCRQNFALTMKPASATSLETRRL